MSKIESYDVFISYSSADRALAEIVHQRLLSDGFRVWFDQARLKAGCDWHQEIEDGCEASRVVVPVLTPRWKESEWTRFETYGAESVIPLLLEGELDDVFTPPLRRFQASTVDLASKDLKSKEKWSQLYEAIREQIRRPQPQKEERLSDVRYRANAFFVGRDEELAKLHEQLQQPPSTNLTQGSTFVIAALGGVGKTTFVRQYVEKFWRCYQQIFWIDCRLGVESEFARICDLMFAEERSEVDVPRKARRALAALENRNDRLLVLDNVEDEVSIQRWLPKSGSCHTLITSRFSGWSAAVNAMHIYVLAPGPSHRLLASRGKNAKFNDMSELEQANCSELANTLGYLPLALEQAAAYIYQQGTGFGFSDYLRLYSAAEEQFLDKHTLGSTEYPRSVATTWSTSIVKLKPGARSILRMCSFFSTAPLPISLLEKSVEILRDEAEFIEGRSESALSKIFSRFLELVPTIIRTVFRPPEPTRVSLSPVETELWIRKHVDELVAYSLVQRVGQSIALHPLVQTVGRSELDQDERTEVMENSIHMLEQGFTGNSTDIRNWPHLEPLVPHAIAICDRMDNTDERHVSLGLYNRLSNMAVEKAQFEDAERWMRRGLEYSKSTQRKGNHEFIVMVGNLAVLLRQTGRYEEAVELTAHALQLAQEVFGDDDHELISFLAGHAASLSDVNQQAEAEALLRQAIAMAEKFLGPDHPRVGMYLANLAAMIGHRTGCDEAERLFRRAIAIDEGEYGPEHPNFATSLAGLATLLNDQGRSKEAEPIAKLALEIMEKSYGDKHPLVATAINNLAMISNALGNHEIGETLLRRAISINESVYGRKHSEVAQNLLNLAGTLMFKKRLDEAECLIHRAVNIYRAAFGALHTKLALALSKQAELEWRLGRTVAAEKTYLESIEIFEALSTDNTIQYAAALHGLAVLLVANNRLKGAEARFKAVNQLVDGSPFESGSIAASNCRHFAQLLIRIKRFSEAEAFLLKAVKIDHASHDDSHPNVAGDLHALGVFLNSQNRFHESEPFLRRALQLEEKRLESDHLIVARTAHALGIASKAQQKYEEAEPLIRRALTIWEQAEGEHQTSIASALISLSDVLLNTNRQTQALSQIHRALSIDMKEHGSDHLLVARDAMSMSNTLRAISREKEAEPYHRMAVEVYLQKTAEAKQQHPNLAEALKGYFVLLTKLELSEVDSQSIIDQLFQKYGLRRS